MAGLVKRGGPPKRKRGLSRASGGLKRSEGPRRTGGPKQRSRPLRASQRRRPQEGPLSPEEWAKEVLRLDGSRCRVTGLSVRLPLDFPHHPVPKSLLRERGLHHLVWDPRNGMTVTAGVHANHESSARRRIPLEAVPQRCQDFAEELGPWAVSALRRRHPPASAGGTYPIPKEG